MRRLLTPNTVLQPLIYWIILQFWETSYARSLCSILGHRSAIVGDRLFFTSGVYNYDDGQKWQNTALLHWLPLDGTIEISGPIDLSLIGSVELPGADHMDSLLADSGGNGEAFFYDQTSLYPYGAWRVPANDGIDSAVWAFNTIESGWNFAQVEGDNLSFSNNNDGIYASDPTTSTSFYVGGLLNRTIKFHSSNSIPTVTTAAQGPNIHEGAMVYIRKGLSGVLLALGGREWGPTGSIQRSFANISVYDISSDTWYVQTATGDIPGLRTQFCAGVSAAPDDSSFQVTIHGGLDTENEYIFNDVYVLSVPSFRWIKIYASNDPDLRGSDLPGRRSHRCDVWNDAQLIVSGGSVGVTVNQDNSMEADYFNSECNATYPPFKVLDTSTYTWRTSFDPNVEYVVPDSITAVIGGRSSGGASLQSPLFNWNSENLRSVFSKTVPRGASQRGIKSKLSKAAIAGIAVAAAVVVIVITAGVLIWLYKKHRLTPKKLAETVGIGATPDNQWHKPELDGSANARHELDISEPRPHELHEEGVAKSELPGSLPPLAELP